MTKRKTAQAAHVSDWRTAQREVWARDQQHCRVCLVRVVKGGDSVTAGHVHHLIPRARLAKGRHADTSLLVLLCAKCHADVHAYRIVLSGNANAGFRVERVKA